MAKTSGIDLEILERNLNELGKSFFLGPLAESGSSIPRGNGLVKSNHNRRPAPNRIRPELPLQVIRWETDAANISRFLTKLKRLAI